MSDIRVFAVSRLGASHLKSGKPCQDSSLSWQSEDGRYHAVITADGHGSDTYVRSDVGSRLAIEITLKHIKAAIEDPEFLRLMQGAKGAVTARPDGPRRMPKNPADRSESQQDLLKQDQLFIRQVSTVKEQDAYFMTMFSGIYKDWMESIQKDSVDHPFTDGERALLGNSKIEKAYGTTLLAFVRTPIYWMAFHLGDGKMLMADAIGQWTEPVPWDCNCFLTMTTSLCNSNPVPCFRYAFDGTGNFPVAVVLGSDGMDDSWGTMDKLKDFYTKILSIIHDDDMEKQPFEQTINELGEYLTKLSAQGSRDDMTMAGIIDMSKLDMLCKISELRQKGSQLKKERDERIKELQELQKKGEEEIANMQKEASEMLSAMRTNAEHQLAEARKKAEQEFLQKKKEAEDQIGQRKKEICNFLEKKKEEIDKENAHTKELFEELKEKADSLKKQALQEVDKPETAQAQPDELTIPNVEITDNTEENTADEQTDDIQQDTL